MMIDKNNFKQVLTLLGFTTLESKTESAIKAKDSKKANTNDSHISKSGQETLFMSELNTKDSKNIKGTKDSKSAKDMQNIASKAQATADSKDSKTHIYTKSYPDKSSISVDFENEKIHYPQELTRESDSTSNFSQNENFVVLECVDRLLSLGYKAQDLVLEKTWKLGHSGKSGRADISIFKEQNIYAIIECKTAGKEYNNAKKELFTDRQGNQLFSYAAQARSVEWLCLYASDYDESTATLTMKDEIIKFKDDDNILHLSLSDKSIATFQAASGTSDFFEAWEETYNKKTYQGLIFNSKAYEIGIQPLYKKDLKNFDKEDGLNIQFQEILRHNNISSRHHAFDILLAIFLAKCYDEQSKSENEKLDFYYNPFSDDYFSLYKRLLKLFICAMKELLNEEVYEPKENFVAKVLKSYIGKNRAKAQELIENEIQEAHLYSAQFFNFKKTYNKKLFNQNGKILAEVVQLFEKYRFSYSSKEQFLGELFETFLNEGFSQNEGVYFTPVPITRFIWNALPFEDFIDVRLKKFPKVIDFACGAGHFLTEGVSAISDFCKASNLDIEDKELSRFFYGIDKDDRLALTTQITMLLNGASEAKIRFIDGLEYDFEFYGDNQQSFDILVANPPFSVKGFKEHLSKNVLRAKNGNVPYQVLELLSNDSKLIELAFVERLTHILKPNALAAIILPSSVLSNADLATIKAREILLENFALVCLCSFGNQTFGTTGTNTAILFLRRFDEPPKKTELLQDSLDSIFHNENLANFEDDEILSEYLSLQGITKEEYKGFLNKELIPQNELFKDYKNAFDESAEIKTLQKASNFQKLAKAEQESIVKEKFFSFALNVEKQKLKYFALTFKQKTLLVKAPDDTEEQKRFLGFSISNAKNKKSGLTETKGLLSDRANRNAKDKIAYAIKQSFYENLHLHEDFEKYLNYAKTCHLLDFSNANFNKAINPNCHTERSEVSRANPFINSKYELVKLGEIITENPKSKVKVSEAKENKSGVYPFYTSGLNIYRYDEALTSGENIYLSTGGNAIVQFYNGESAYSTDTYVIKSKDKRALTKFIFYILETQTRYINDFLFKGTGLKHLQKPEFKNLKIPLPPLDIQKQIVSECEKVEFQAHNIEALITQYQSLIKAILVKTAICESFTYEPSQFTITDPSCHTDHVFCHTEGEARSISKSSEVSQDLVILSDSDAGGESRLNPAGQKSNKDISAFATQKPQYDNGRDISPVAQYDKFDNTPMQCDQSNINETITFILNTLENLESKLDFSFLQSLAHNENLTCHTEGEARSISKSSEVSYNQTCHTEHSEVSYKDSINRDISPVAQYDKKSITLTQNQLAISKYPAFTYIITNKHNTTLYIGVTSNLQKRIYEHKNHLLEGFSDKYNLEKLVYFESFDSIEQAIEREKYLKGKKREFKENLINSINPKWLDLYEYLFCHTEEVQGTTEVSQYDKDSVMLGDSEKSPPCHVERSETSHNRDISVVSLPQYDNLSALLESLPTPPPQGWEYKKLGEISHRITKGTTPTTLGFKFLDKGINFIKVESLTENGEFIAEKIAYISQECHDKLERSQLQQNDILFSIAGALGRVGIVNENILPANTNQALAIIRLTPNLNNIKFIKTALSTDDIKTQIDNFKKGIAQQNLSLEQIESLQIPLPPLDSQNKIVEAIENIEAHITQIDSKLAELEQEKAQILNRILNGDNERERERDEAKLKLILTQIALLQSQRMLWLEGKEKALEKAGLCQSESTSFYTDTLESSSCHTESSTCHTERSEVSHILNNRDISAFATQKPQYDNGRDISPQYNNACHFERSEKSQNIESNRDTSLPLSMTKQKPQYDTLLSQVMTKELLQSLPTPPKEGWERVRLNNVAFYPQDRIDISLLTPQNYVGVDNLLQNKQGKKEAEFVLEDKGTTNAYKKDDILIGNIRPYLKKIWFADVSGGTNNDVVVVRSKDTQKLKPKFLYYILSDDNFFQYEMDSAKGQKMPRGDKTAILGYRFPLPPLASQNQIVAVIEKIESQINSLQGLSENLASQKGLILQEFL